MDYVVKIDEFSGPLDLLLSLTTCIFYQKSAQMSIVKK